jgi:hypothetical protein
MKIYFNDGWYNVVNYYLCPFYGVIKYQFYTDERRQTGLETRTAKHLTKGLYADQ